MRKMYLILLAFLMLSALSLQAQVTIGSQKTAHSGSLLELDTSAGNRGILLPRIFINDVQVWGLEGSDQPVEGMLVFNTNPNLSDGTGIYVWLEDEAGVGSWTVFKGGGTSGGGGGTGTVGTTCDKVKFTLTFNGASMACPGSELKGYSVVASGGEAPYTYDCIDFEQDGNIKSGTRMPSDGPKAFALKITDTNGCYANAVFSVNQQTDGCSDIRSDCGAFNASGKWMTFMCHNLGADADMSPYEYNDGILGDLYQWGRKKDGHQSRFSGTAAGAVSAPNLDADGQIKEGAAAYGLFVKHTAPGHATYPDASYMDWRYPSNADLWGITKKAGDPCPSGWRVPTQPEWSSIYKGTNANPTASAGDQSWKWTGKGYQVLDNEGKVAMYLPAAGYRHSSTGAIAAVSTEGYYWAASTYTYSYTWHTTAAYASGVTSNPLYLRFGASFVYPGTEKPANNYTNTFLSMPYAHRASGQSVRCLKYDPVSKVILDKTALSIYVKASPVKLSATVTPSDATNGSVSWKSSNEAVATVDANGTVTPKTVGTTVITVTTTDGSKTATCNVTVTSATACGKSGTPGNVASNDLKNVYLTYQYGTDCWMVSNSKDGTATQTTYSGKTASVNGNYYTWSNAATACPTGWHIPTTSEWESLRSALNADKTATDTQWWFVSTSNAFAGSYYTSSSSWSGWDSYGYWWGNGSTNQAYQASSGSSGLVSSSTNNNSSALNSVRCVQTK